MGYSQLSKTSQNLADKYRHLQKTANIPSLLIPAEIQSQQSRQNETTLTQRITTLLKSVQSALSDLKRPPERLQSHCNYWPFIT